MDDWLSVAQLPLGIVLFLIGFFIIKRNKPKVEDDKSKRSTKLNMITIAIALILGAIFFTIAGIVELVGAF